MLRKAPILLPPLLRQRCSQRNCRGPRSGLRLNPWQGSPQKLRDDAHRSRQPAELAEAAQGDRYPYGVGKHLLDAGLACSGGSRFHAAFPNPQHLRALQGSDAKQIAEFLQDRRLDGSFVPPAAVRQLRIPTRHRVALLHQCNEVHNQIRDIWWPRTCWGSGLLLSTPIGPL